MLTDTFKQLYLAADSDQLILTPRRRLYGKSAPTVVPPNGIGGGNLFLSLQDTLVIDDGLIWDALIAVVTSTAPATTTGSGIFLNSVSAQITAIAAVVPSAAPIQGPQTLVVSPATSFFSMRDLQAISRLNNGTDLLAAGSQPLNLQFTFTLQTGITASTVTIALTVLYRVIHSLREG